MWLYFNRVKYNEYEYDYTDNDKNNSLKLYGG